jgi:DNA polymerase I
MPTNLNTFKEVWLVDFEFRALAGERPSPICMVARELQTGQTLRLWGDDLLAQRVAPYPLGPEALLVAYYASAELGCHLALNWPMPARILDLFAEFRCITSGLDVVCGNGLLGAMTYFVSVAEGRFCRATPS